VEHENDENETDREESNALIDVTDSGKHRKNGVGLKRLPELPPLNDSFFTPINMAWFNHVAINWMPPEDKALVMLPCGNANKTRGKKRINGKIDPKGEIDPRKFISEGMGHNCLKAIRDDPLCERVILSEPLVLIPLCLEANELRPDYNLPVTKLCIMGEDTFINRLSQWLLKLKFLQPSRKFIYYCGATHHFLILWFANQRAGSPFSIIYNIGEIIHYTRLAENIVSMIHDLEERSIMPNLEPIGEIIQHFLNSKGRKDARRYTHQRFWRSVLVFHIPTEKEKKEHEEQYKAALKTETLDGHEYVIETVDICTAEFNHEKGFAGLYELEDAKNYVKMPKRIKTLDMF